MVWEKIKKKSKETLGKIKLKGISEAEYTEIDPNKLPDAKKYIDLDERTRADKITRGGLMAGLVSIGDALKEAHTKFIELQLLQSWTQMDELINRVEVFYNDVINPDYGFSTYFEVKKIEDIDFKFVRVLEYEILTKLKTLEESVISFKNKISSENFVDAGIDNLKIFSDKLLELQQLYEERRKLISSYEKLAV
ncbi:MAG: hypothetical protein ACFFCD_08275 [Promethearchaeota archaeon]